MPPSMTPIDITALTKSPKILQAKIISLFYLSSLYHLFTYLEFRFTPKLRERDFSYNPGAYTCTSFPIIKITHLNDSLLPRMNLH